MKILQYIKGVGRDYVIANIYLLLPAVLFLLLNCIFIYINVFQIDHFKTAIEGELFGFYFLMFYILSIPLSCIISFWITKKCLNPLVVQWLNPWYGILVFQLPFTAIFFLFTGTIDTDYEYMLDIGLQLWFVILIVSSIISTFLYRKKETQLLMVKYANTGSSHKKHWDV